jgi:endoglucanase
MRKLFFAFILILASFFISEGYAIAVPRLAVAGGRIVDSTTGEAVQLRGMSLFWSQWSGSFWNAAVVAQARDWGATVIRAAMGVEQGGYLQNPAIEEARVAAIVAAAVEADIYVIIDWHAHGEHRPEAIAFFAKMARLYGKTPNVIFEIWNEPIAVGWEQVRSYSIDVVGAIRAEGADGIVILGTPSWSQDVDIAAAHPVEGDNLVYALHFYAATHRQYLRDKAALAIKRGATLFVSEWGAVNAMARGPVDYAEADRWMAFLDLHGIGWTNWSLFNKNESSSVFRPSASATGPWSVDDLTASGQYVVGRL